MQGRRLRYRPIQRRQFDLLINKCTFLTHCLNILVLSFVLIHCNNWLLSDKHYRARLYHCRIPATRLFPRQDHKAGRIHIRHLPLHALHRRYEVDGCTVGIDIAQCIFVRDSLQRRDLRFVLDVVLIDRIGNVPVGL